MTRTAKLTKGGAPRKFTDEEFAGAFDAAGGDVATTAMVLGVTCQTVRNRVKAKPRSATRRKAAPRKRAATEAPPAVGLPVRVTNAQIRQAMFDADGNRARAARALGITRTMLQLLLPEDAEPKTKADDGSVSVAEFDQACNARRDARRRKREAEGAAGHERTKGCDANEVIGAFAEDDNPDAHATKAARLLEKRTASNRRVMVLAAAVELEMDMAAELARLTRSRRELQQALDVSDEELREAADD